MAAHWLQKRAAGTYDYDIHVSTSTDGGQNWSPSFIPHTDSVAAEHGFVTLLPLPNGRIFATWLDGRNNKTESSQDETEHHHGGGAMTLRAAEFDVEGNLFAEAEIDDRVCDCCQTDAILTENGPIVVYRNRTEEEVRDIYLSRRIDGQWQAPQKIGHDDWTIHGCPVNGPAIAAKGNTVAVAWFTMAGDEAKIQIVFSQDGGQTFGEVIRIDQQDAIGRIDVVLVDNHTELAAFLEDEEADAFLKIIPVHSNGMVGDPIYKQAVDPSRKSGFPILEKVNNGFLLAFTVVEDTNTEVRSVQIMKKN